MDGPSKALTPARTRTRRGDGKTLGLGTPEGCLLCAARYILWRTNWSHNDGTRAAHQEQWFATPDLQPFQTCWKKMSSDVWGVHTVTTRTHAAAAATFITADLGAPIYYTYFCTQYDYSARGRASVTG